MDINIISTYDETTKHHLISVWEKVIHYMTAHHDVKKIVSFLAKCGIIGIEEKSTTIYIWVPNEFIITQVKKFFLKSLQDAIHEVYNPQFSVKLIVYTPFQKDGNGLHINLKKILQVKETKNQTTNNVLQPKIKDELSSHFGILFDPIYRFDTFVVGANNNFAYSASKAIVENPGKVYNPFFMYGKVWLGKTHLMQAIGNRVIEHQSEKVVLYLPASKLIDEIVIAIRWNKLEQLMRKFDAVDVLIIDDVQFLADKEKTQEIFHNIFNDFHMKKKQVILSSDRPPKELVNIAARLKSRFSLGLVADIQAPDYETRLAILQSKLDKKDESIDEDYLGLIAKYVKDNVRELEWALNIVLTKKMMTKDDLQKDDIYQCLKTLGYSTTENVTKTSVRELSQENMRSNKNFSNLVEMVGEYYGISVQDLKSESRKKEITIARQVLMMLAKRYFHWTFEKIGDFFGGKNHASVIYAVQNIEKKLKTDSNLEHDYQVFVDRLQQ